MKLEAKKYRRAQRLAAVRRDRGRNVLPGHDRVRDQTYNFLSIPFLSLFVGGYYWAGFGTLYQEHQGRLRWLKQQKLAAASGRRRASTSAR